jgi:hypothetical protein
MGNYRHFVDISDPSGESKRELSFFDRFLMKFINDTRDLPFLHYSILMTVVVLPLAAITYIIPHPWLYAMFYLPFVLFFFMGRYILMLHNISHRPLFRKQYRFLKNYIVWVLGPLVGETPETYFVHHVGMHHVEENLEEDLSSTMRFRRDSFWHWLRYFVKFFFQVYYELFTYLVKRGRRKMLGRFIAGELVYFTVIVLMMQVSVPATLIVFLIPWAFCRAAMIAGNWAQHAFIDATSPEDPYLSSITAINSRYNRICFNDGYHIGHHLNATLHWTEMPNDFINGIKEYRDKGAVVFTGLDYHMIWALLMFKKYNVLAKHFVDLELPARPMAEIEALLKSRTRPVPQH